MENMDKGLTVPKLVLIVQLNIPQMPQNLSAQLVCPSPKVLAFDKKGFIGRQYSVDLMVLLSKSTVALERLI